MSKFKTERELLTYLQGYFHAIRYDSTLLSKDILLFWHDLIDDLLEENNDR